MGLIAVSGCSRSASSTPPAKAADEPAKPTSVTLVQPVKKDMIHKIEQPGEIQAFEQTPIYPKVTGYIAKVLKDIDDPVKEGEALAELSVPEMEVELRQKEALVEQADAELTLAREMVGVADAELARSKGQFERLTKVGKSGVIDKENVDEAQYAFESSKAKRGIADAEVKVKQARLSVAKANRDQLQELLKYTTVRAPYTGVVVQRHVDTGHLVQPPQGARRDPLFVVARKDPVRIFVDVPEADALDVRNNARAVVRIEAIPGHEFPGTVARSAWGLDARARTLRTEIDLKNPDGKLRPGMYAQAAILVVHPQVFAVPSAAVATAGDLRLCFRADNGKAVRLPVKVGVTDQGFTQLLMKEKAGVPGTWEKITGDEEIIANAAGIKDGDAVSVSPGGK